MKRMSFILLCVLLVGCASVGRKLDQASVDRIQIGKTTRQDVLASLGSPDQLTRLGNSDVIFSYHYIHAAAKPESYIPIVGAFAGGANVQQQIVMITFGQDDIVKNVMSTQGATESGYNLGAGDKASIPDVEQGKRQP
ncbi:MAG: outer membrane protein assembly factor BamE [Verrucomicrobiia bacterium]|jgi:outer membrane protein assembly factor BamE (lipoprotein component of BamABCDE complex)